MNQRVLITGGTGLVGTRLTELLIERGYQVSYLSRSAGSKGNITTYTWDVEAQTLDPEAITTADYIIHLAGAGVADKRWNAQRKKEILESRVKSTALLRSQLQQLNHSVKAFVSASAIGIYGQDTGTAIISESAPVGKDFLADVTRQWEQGVEEISALSKNIRVVKLRIGIVMSSQGGALEKMLQPIKLGLGSPLASGKQYMSWIHIDDLCNMFIHAMEHSEVNGVYNAVAPEPVTNEEITKAAANAAGKSIVVPNVPAFALKIALGEMAGAVIGGSRVSSERIERTGFKFKYPKVDLAMTHLISQG